MLNKRILLIVDDCATDRKIYSRYLLKETFYSYEILEADSAGEGILLYEQKQCDAILLDFCLPDMDGLNFLDKLSYRGYENSIPVIMMTGYGDEEIAVRAMKRGIQDYLVKQHLKEDILRLAVRNAIEKSYLQAQLNQTRERQRLIATTALRIRKSLNLEQILQTAVTEVHQLLGCDAVVVYQFTQNASV
ncbi:MAG: response regulator [Calothrix sp. SM1_7_51]|nr:response regulator [Calothrix sp. SM1_7_51]